jgi:hypothetical protein
MVQRISQLPRAPGKSAISADGGAAKGGAIGRTQQPTLSATATARERQEISSIEQQSTPFENDQIQVLVGQDDRAAAGVAADGGSERELGSVMKMAILLDGELTPVRRSKRNADVADVGSLEKAEKRIAVKNLEEPQRNLHDKSFCSFSKICIEENLGGVGISLGDRQFDYRFY